MLTKQEVARLIDVLSKDLSKNDNGVDKNLDIHMAPGAARESRQKRYLVPTAYFRSQRRSSGSNAVSQ